MGYRESNLEIIPPPDSGRRTALIDRDEMRRQQSAIEPERKIPCTRKTKHGGCATRKTTETTAGGRKVKRQTSKR